MLELWFYRHLAENETANNPLNPEVDNYHYFSHDEVRGPQGRVLVIGTACSTTKKERFAVTVAKHVNGNETQRHDALWLNAMVRVSYYISPRAFQYLWWVILSALFILLLQLIICLFEGLRT